MAKLKNIHPGEILSEEFLLAFNISAYKLAKDIEIPQTRISEIIKGNRRITADKALRISNILVILRSSGLACRMILIWKKKLRRKLLR